ncbi:hypothetical protein NAPIS_ORF00151 [Vairimorpha apis BRL 01]|uniref:Uncharacterized protein n=1 Tax=Vairimorpha apis BRL 01 TaxID=1037528 RepID=T0L449_9MICR|nr:hypothetical protein NAPIS_ORF00151 [Vairimorpha apis BRL 01]
MNQIKYNNITYTDIFEYIIENINIIIDDNIRTICISGLQSIFINELKNAKPKFLNVLIVLFIFNNEKEHYDINWKEKILQTLSISNEYMSNMNFFTKKYIKSSKDQYALLKYKLYITINSTSVKHNLLNYKEIQNNLSQMKLIHYFIDLVNKTKCKLFNIENIKHQ